LNAGPEDPEKSEEEAGHGGKGSHKSLASIEEGRTLGFRFEDPLENGELTYEQYKERFLIAKESEDRKWGAYFNFMVLGTVQHHFNMPSLVTGKGKEQVPLYSPWGSGNSILFENPITGLPESISRQFPLKDDFTRYSGELNFELLLRSPLGHTIIDFDPFYITEPKESGQLKYEVDKFGAQANIGYLPWGFSGNGDIDGFVKLKNVTKPSRFDWKGRIRHTFPDINFRVPGLAKWAEEKWDVDPFGINDNEPTFMDELAKMLFNPTFSVSVYYEHKPESDANRETLLEAAEDEWGVIVASKDTGLFVQLYEQRNTTKLYWEKVKAWRVGVALPLKSVFHILGAEALENSVADPFELDKFGFPIATTHYILRDASKVTFFVEGKKYENPQNPLIGELKRGTIGPGGRGGKDVTGESLGAGFAYSHVFKEEPFPNSPFWNKVMSNTRIQLGAQVMKLEIKGNDKPIVTQLFGQGSFGSVTVNTPASVQPKPDQDLWWSATFAMDKNWKMPGNAGYITTGFFVDYREILGEVTNNELGDDPIITVGGYVGWTPKNRFYRSVINL
jgi:hypothetical protein